LRALTITIAAAVLATAIVVGVVAVQAAAGV